LEEEELKALLKPFASEHCIKRGLSSIKILDKELVEGYGFYTVQGIEEGSSAHAVKVFPDGTIYCSDQGFRFHHMAQNKKLCSHLVKAIADMNSSGVDVREIMRKLAFGSGSVG
jgi:hypothetical protein